MADDSPDDIGTLEERIETLAAEIERCRKISLSARLAIAAGAIWIALVLLGVIPFSASPVIAAIAAVIGGTVLLGSNSTTWRQAEAALQAAEAARAELIGRLDLRLVGEERRRLLH